MAKDPPRDEQRDRRGGDSGERPPAGGEETMVGPKSPAQRPPAASKGPGLKPLAPPPPAAPPDAAPATPFGAADDEWESELAAWDAAIPIVTRAPGSSSQSGSTPSRRGTAAQAGAGGAATAANDDAEGALPAEENPFAETPTTVAGPAQLLDLEDVPDMFSAGTFDDGLAPASGSYAALVATDQSVPGIFDRDPPPEPIPSFPTDTLREMSPRAWSEDLRTLITLGPGQTVTSPPRAYWETLASIIAEERAAAPAQDSPAGAAGSSRPLALCLAAARLADELGETAQALAHLEAAFAIDGSSPVGHRARLLLAERGGPLQDDAATESLARLAFTTHPDQPYYRALYAEWALLRSARGFSDGATAAAVASIPDGLARTLAEAELAWRDSAVAAALLETAGHRVAGGLGAALLLCAAGLNERALDFQAAAEQRFVAARLDEQRSPGSLGILRDLARLEAPAVVPAMEDLLARLPSSALKVALARWGAAAALRLGDAAGAWRMVAATETLGPGTASLARDRLDLWRAGRSGGAPGDPAPGPVPGIDPAPPGDGRTLQDLTTTLWEACSSPLARVCVALRACQLARDQEEFAFAVNIAERAAAEFKDAPALGAAVERLAQTTRERQTRLRALRLWRDLDPARWTAASLDLVDEVEEAAAAPAPPLSPQTAHSRSARGEAAPPVDSVENVLAEVAARDATSPAFWRLAAMAARRGRFADAAASLDRGRAGPAWSASCLAPALGELAAEYMARIDLAEAATRLATSRPKQPSPDAQRSGGEPAAPAAVGPRLTRGRVLRDLGDRDLWAAHVDDEIALGPADQPADAARDRRAALFLEPVFWRNDTSAAGAPARAAEGGPQSDGEDVPALVAAALDAASLHPVALALALEAAPDPAILVDRLVAGGSGPGGPRWLLGAAIAAAVAGDAPRGLTLAVQARTAADPGGAGPEWRQLRRSANTTIRRLAWTASSAEQRAEMLRDLAASSDGAAVALVEAAEALEDITAAQSVADGRGEARRLFEAAAFASGHAAVAADVRLGLERLSPAAPDGPIPLPGDGDGHPGERRRDQHGLRFLEGVTRAQRWDDVVTALIDSPPHQEEPGVEILSLAATVDEGRAAGNRAPEIWVRARAGVQPPAAEVTADLRAGDRLDADPVDTSAALARLAAAAANAADGRSAALLSVEAARLAALNAGQGQGNTPQQRLLQAAVSHDATSAAAAIAWRRFLVNAGRAEDAARAFGAEAEALVAPSLRVQALVHGAVLLLRLVGDEKPVASHEVADPAAVARVDQAAALLERALRIDPQAHAVFSRLRDLYDETGRHAALARLLETRLTVTSNPFETTALRLARADIFADGLHDRAQAKAELEAILQKEPQHARALARLADLEQEDGNDAAAADLLIRRAFVERSPEKLRDLFLRLGRIYTQRIPDPKRAVGAYARVLQLDANSREALDELSRLYLGLGETKSAIAITERLVRIETVPENRSRYHIRLAQLAERAGDPRSATLHFRRAAEDAPRDIEALGELVRYLDKTRDTSGRRAYLDRAATDLRAAVLTDPTDASAIAALVAVLRWRGRTAAAAAAAELLLLATAPPSPTGYPGAATPPGDGPGALPAWATPPASGRHLAALTQPAVDEETFPETVPSSVRHLFRLLSPVLSEGTKPAVARYGLDRGARAASGRSPRDVFDRVGAEMAAGPFDLYIAPFAAPATASRDPAFATARTATSAAVVLAVEPGKPPAIILGAPVMALGQAAVRFAAARSLRLIATHLDAAFAAGPEDLGIWIGGVVRQFVADYRHPEIPPERLAARAARVAKLLPKKLRQEIMPFAMECSGPLDLTALHAGIRDAANRVGLLAAGSLDAALRVLLLTAGSGEAEISPPVPTAALAASPEAQALLAFALSDGYDDLVRALE